MRKAEVAPMRKLMNNLMQGIAPAERRLPSNSLERALVFLQVIAWRTKGLTTAEVSREFRLSSSTCSYILKRLEMYGYVHRDKDSGRYQIGQMIAALARWTSPPENSSACFTSTVLQDLVAKVHGAAAVGLLRGGRTVIIDHVSAEIPMRKKLGIGSDLPLGTTLGKMFLAWMPRDEVEDMIKRYGLFPERKEPVCKVRFFRELEQIRMCEYAFVTGVYPGVCSVAAPIFSPSGSLRAGLLVNGTLDQPEWKEPDTVISLVLTAAKQISHLDIDWQQFDP